MFCALSLYRKMVTGMRKCRVAFGDCSHNPRKSCQGDCARCRLQILRWNCLCQWRWFCCGGKHPEPDPKIKQPALQSFNKCTSDILAIRNAFRAVKVKSRFFYGCYECLPLALFLCNHSAPDTLPLLMIDNPEIPYMHSQILRFLMCLLQTA